MVGPNLRLVFLQACESARSDPRANVSGVAMRLALQNIPAVIAMQSKVQNQVANAFAVRFYEMMDHDVPIDWAVKEARAAVERMNELTPSQKLAFGTPVVYLSSYRALIDRAADLTAPPQGVKSPTKTLPPPRKLRATVAECPNCSNHLTSRFRSYCTRCKLQLRCDNCSIPLDQPNAQGCYCGECGRQIKSLTSDTTTEPRVLSTRGLAAEAPPPVVDVTMDADLQAQLRRRFATRPSDGGSSN